jgi:hypothetical protein
MTIKNLVLFFVLFGGFTVVSFAQLQIRNSVFGAGGRPAAGANINLEGTVGQTVIGKSSSDFSISLGFWTWSTMPPLVAVDKFASPTSATIQVSEAYPNPFFSEAHFTVRLPEPGELTILLYNVSGVRLKTMMEEYRFAGTASVSLSAEGLENGTYFVSVRYGRGESISRVLVKR